MSNVVSVVIIFDTCFQIVFFRYGTNTGGMFVRPADNYTNGASVQYDGLNGQLAYWMGRPDKYKPCIVQVDDCVSSQLVDLAIRWGQSNSTTVLCFGLCCCLDIVAIKQSACNVTWLMFLNVFKFSRMSCMSKAKTVACIQL